MKKVIKGIINTISVALILLAIVVLLVVVTTPKGQAPSLFGCSVFRVVTKSMNPTLRVDDMILVKKVKPASLKEGDIISFYSTDPSIAGEVNTHRIVGITVEDNGARVFDTKGDANNIKDDYPVKEANLIGKVIGHSQFMGRAVHLLSNPLIFVPIILIPLIIMIILNIRQTYKLAKAIAVEEEALEIKEKLESKEETEKTAEEILAEAEKIRAEAEAIKAEASENSAGE